MFNEGEAARMGNEGEVVRLYLGSAQGAQAVTHESDFCRKGAILPDFPSLGAVTGLCCWK